MHSVTGELLRTWRGHRINDLALTADGRHLLATPSGEACVRVYQLDGERETALLSVQSIISICLAADSRDLLVSSSDALVQPSRHSSGPLPQSLAQAAACPPGVAGKNRHKQCCDGLAAASPVHHQHLSGCCLCDLLVCGSSEVTARSCSR